MSLSRAALVVSCVIAAGAVTEEAHAGPEAFRGAEVKRSESLADSKSVPPAYVVSMPVVAPPSATSCTGYWKATIENVSGVAGRTTGTGQGWYVSNGVDVGGAGGWDISIPGRGQSSTASAGFTPKFDTTEPPTHLRVEIRLGSERIASSPAAPIPAPPSLDATFIGVGTGSGTSFSVALRNRLAQAYDATNVVVLTQSGPSSTGPWVATTPANFWALGCVYAQKDTKTFIGTKPADHRYIRIEASRPVFNPASKQWEKVKIERIVDTTPPKASDFKLPTAPIMKR